MAPSLGIQYSSVRVVVDGLERLESLFLHYYVDTRWGVPRYDTSKETETYLMSGSMLPTMVTTARWVWLHRSEDEPESGQTVLHSAGGDFSRIYPKG